MSVAFLKSSKWNICAMAVGVIALIASAVFWRTPHNSWVEYADTAWLAVLVCGTSVSAVGFKKLIKNRRLSSELIAFVAILVCVALELYSYFSRNDICTNCLLIGGGVALFTQAGCFSIDLIVKRKEAVLYRALDALPKTVVLSIKGESISMPVESVKSGDKVIVGSGEVVGIDGILYEGESKIDERIVHSGTKVLVKKKGDCVWAGTVNLESRIVIKAFGGKSKAVEMLEDAITACKTDSPVKHKADRWAVALACCAFVCGAIITVIASVGGEWLSGLLGGVTVLTAATCSAVAYSAIAAATSGIGSAAKSGVIVKSCDAFEVLARCDTVFFDKTGTLTNADMSVTQFVTNRDEREFWSYVSSIEAASSNPIAILLKSKASEMGCVAYPVQNPVVTVGTGIRAVVNGKETVIGKWESFNSYAVSGEMHMAAQACLREGNTLIAIAVDGEIWGIISIRDTLRGCAADAVAELKEMRINTVMLTGDNAHSATKAAKSVGIDEYRSGLLPDNKVKVVETFIADGHTVLLVDNSPEDTTAMNAADCAVIINALHDGGVTDIADIIVVDDDIVKLPRSIGLCRRTMASVNVSICIAFVLCIACAVIAAFGWLNPAWGALINAVSSVLIVLYTSAFRVGKRKSKRATANRQ